MMKRLKRLRGISWGCSMRTHFKFFVTAFIALIWYACLNAASVMGASSLVGLLFVAAPWCGIVGLWIHSEDRYDAGYQIGRAAGEYEAMRKTVTRVISKKIWAKYQALRTMRYKEGITPEMEKERSAEVLRMHLAMFYDIPKQLDGIREGECVFVERPWSRYREAE